MGSGQSHTPQKSVAPAEPYYPTGRDIRILRQSFLQYLPLELIDVILDMAKYWPCVHAERYLDVSVRSAQHGDSLYPVAEYCYLVTPLIPTEAKMVKEVVFRTESHDQGWGGEPEHRGTYRGSWTWFEAAIIRSEHYETPWWLLEVEKMFPVDVYSEGMQHRNEELEEAKQAEVHSLLVPAMSRWHVVSNMTGRTEYRIHEIRWQAGEHVQVAEEYDSERGLPHTVSSEFVSLLQRGDRIALMAKTKFPMWVNSVRRASIDILYKV